LRVLHGFRFIDVLPHTIEDTEAVSGQGAHILHSSRLR
jgi:hypothetical protein